MTTPSLLDLQLAEPPKGSVVRFKVGFHGSPKSYTYSAIEAGGLWYVTGRDGAVGRKWGQLLQLLFRTDSIVLSAELATSWENL